MALPCLALVILAPAVSGAAAGGPGEQVEPKSRLWLWICLSASLCQVDEAHCH